MREPDRPASSSTVVAAGYDAVYAAMPHTPTLRRIWREHVLGGDYPEEFAHISFLTLDELRRLSDSLALSAGSHVVDLACGAGGPGLWVAREAGTRLTGIDISEVAVAKASERAAATGLSERARFLIGTFAATGLEDASADAAMSADALQYAPDKGAAFREAARILRPGGRLAFTAFELEPARVANQPVLGEDPMPDYREALAEAGFDVTTCEETAGWRELVTQTYEAISAAKADLFDEMGQAAASALLFEVSTTLEIKPYRRRVFASAVRRA